MQQLTQPINDKTIAEQVMPMFFSAPPMFNAATVPNNRETPNPLTIT
jgi:hypothetical protein